jgi:hypothetical protein
LRTASQRDGPVGVELHFDRQPLGPLGGQVDADLAHDFDDLRPDLLSGLLSGRFRPDVGQRVASAPPP